VNPITWVQGLNGTTLIVAICLLMFIEETGVPLPFAPGDLVLAIAGIAVAGGRVNPVGLVAAVAVVAALAGLTGWLGYRAYEKHEANAKRDLFVQVARQGAVNLTTINYTEVDADVQRIVDLSTGAFRDDFEQRSKPFVEVVKAAQSKSEGTVTDAGLESQRGDSAQVLVAVAVKSRTAGGEEAPREWRMRIEVRSVGPDAKVSNVVFVP